MIAIFAHRSSVPSSSIYAAVHACRSDHDHAGRHAGMHAVLYIIISSSCLHFVHQVVWKPLLFIRSRCAMALMNDPTDDVEMIDDTNSTATIQIEWTRWWNKPSEHWPGYTSWEVLRWWAKRTRPWEMKQFLSLFKYIHTLKIIFILDPCPPHA